MEKKEMLSLKKKRMMTYFIEATEILLKKEGVEKITIRKIASAAGYNSATLYNYFPDLDYLILYGSVCYLRTYISLLTKKLQPQMTSLEQYRTIYSCFNECAFKTPEIYYNMFFGRYSHKLKDIIHTYYWELFPDELNGLSPQMQNMLVGGNLKERDEVMMDALVTDGFVDPDKAGLVLEIIIALHERYIHQACLYKEQLDMAVHAENFMKLFNYVLVSARPQRA